MAEKSNASSATVAVHAFADRLSRSPFGLDRLVIDTELKGTYNISLDLADPAHPE